MAPRQARPADPTGSAQDERLLRGLAAGDEESFSELSPRHAEAVVRIPHRLVGDHDLDDVVQQTFCHAVSRARDVRDRSRLRAWLVTIAVRRSCARAEVGRRLSTHGPHRATTQEMLP